MPKTKRTSPLPAQVSKAIATEAMRNGLTPRQTLFAAKLLETNNKTEAYRQAYSTSKADSPHLRKDAFRLSNNPNVVSTLLAGQQALVNSRISQGIADRELLANVLRESIIAAASKGDTGAIAKLAKPFGELTEVQAFAKRRDASQIAEEMDLGKRLQALADDISVIVDVKPQPISLAQSVETVQVIENTSQHEPYDELGY